MIIGSESALQAVQQVVTTVDDSDRDALSAPFVAEETGIEGETLYEQHSEAINAACYDVLFRWIPLYKETGGFSTFKFEDFIDRRMCGSDIAVRVDLIVSTTHNTHTHMHAHCFTLSPLSLSDARWHHQFGVCSFVRW